LKAAVAVKAGDLLAKGAAASTAGVILALHTTTATLLTNVAAFAVAIEDIAAAAYGWCALAVEITDPPTIGDEGIPSQGSLVAATDEILENLYLSGTGGQATSTAPSAAATALVKQYVGWVTAIDKIVLAPNMQIIPAALS